MAIQRINRWDGYRNFLSGVGGPLDKTQQSFFQSFPLIPDAELTMLWAGEGLTKKIVSAPADDMTKNWFTIPSDPEDLILKEMMRLKAKSSTNLATKWYRLYRGSVMVMGIRDGRKLSQPVNVNNIKGIDWLKVYSASRININVDDIQKDPRKPFFEDVEWFNIRKNSGGYMKVHRSRCLVFKGEPVPDSTVDIGSDRIYWGMSILQGVMERLTNFGSVEQSVANLLMEFVIGKYKISNLAELLAENNTEQLYTRMNIIDKSKSLIHAVLLGEDESYDRDTANVSGLPDLLDRFMIILSAVTEIPVTILWGRSPAGENATGEADLDRYYAMIKSKQESQLLEQMQELAITINSYLNATEDVPVVVFKSPRMPTPVQQLEMDKKQAETDQIYINTGVRTPEDVAEERFPEDE